MVELVRSGFTRYFDQGPEAVRDLLDPNAEWLSREPGPWDCHSRDDIIRFLHDFQAGGVEASILEISGRDDRVLLGLRRITSKGEVIDGYSIVSLRNGLVTRIQSYANRALALEAEEQP